MAKKPQNSKPPKSDTPQGKPQDVYTAREATKREVGDVADKITRAPKKR